MEIEHRPLDGEVLERVAAPLPSGRTFVGADTCARMTLLSVGFKYGPPPANHVFDVSFLKNPARQEGWNLWSEPGDEMCEWVVRQAEAAAFVDAVLPLLRVLARVDDDARIAFGCSAGRHRSAILVEEIARHLRGEGIEVAVIHRERDCSTNPPQ